MAESILLSIVMVLAVFLLGALLLWAILIKPGKLDILSVSFPLGGGILTWILFVLSLAGMPINILSVIVVYGITLVLLVVVIQMQTARIGEGRSYELDTQQELEPIIRRSAWIVLGVIFSVAVIYAVGRSYSSYDAASGWAVKGYGIVEEGTVLAASRWGMWGSAYPLNLSLQIGLFKLLSGDLLPSSKVIYPIFAISLLLGCYRFWRMHRVHDVLALLGVFFLATNPFIFLHSTLGYANLPFAFYIVMASLLAIDGFRNGDGRILLLSGILYGLAAWTRAEGIGYCLVVLSAIIIAQWITGNRKLKIIPILIPLIVISGVWLIFGRSGIEDSHLGEAMGGVLPQMMNGKLNLYELRIIPTLFVRRALSPDNWGYFIPVTLVLIVLGLNRIHPRKYPVFFSVLMMTAAMVMIPIGLYYIRSFTRPDNLGEILVRDFDRAFLPAGVAIIILGFSLFGSGDLSVQQLFDYLSELWKYKARLKTEC